MNQDKVISLVFGESDDALMAVDHVFAVLEAVYGGAWLRALGTTPLATAKTVWAFQLSDFTHCTAAKRKIMWALKNAPETVPNAIQFRNLCRMAPSAEVPALPAPKADPQRVADELAKLAPAREKWAKSESTGMKDWAHRLKARHEAGDPTVNPNQVRCYKSALREAA